MVSPDCGPPIDEGLREGRQIPLVRALGGQRFLALGQLGHNPVCARFQGLVTGAGIHQGAGRKIMAHAVAADFATRRFPAAVGLGA